jgi:phosphatidylglycerophosphate synthase
MNRLHYWEPLHSLAILAAIATYWLGGDFFLQLIGGVAGCSFLALTSMSATQWRNDYWLGGPANWVTWWRFGLSLLLLYLMPAAPAWQLSAIGLLAIILDGVDGALARRFQTQSSYGARFDGEADAFFVLVMSIVLYSRGYAGSWILGMGLLRYLYCFPHYLLGQRAETEKSRPYARTIAGIVMVGMPAALLTPPWLHRWALPALALLLFYSFNRELWERASARPRSS